MATVAESRMTREEAEAALAQVEKRLARHTALCDQCQRERFSLFNRCPQWQELSKVETSLRHRLAYIAMKARRAQKKASKSES